MVHTPPHTSPGSQSKASSLAPPFLSDTLSRVGCEPSFRSGYANNKFHQSHFDCHTAEKLISNVNVNRKQLRLRQYMHAQRLCPSTNDVPVPEKDTPQTGYICSCHTPCIAVGAAVCDSDKKWTFFVSRIFQQKHQHERSLLSSVQQNKTTRSQEFRSDSSSRVHQMLELRARLQDKTKDLDR